MACWLSGSGSLPVKIVYFPFFLRALCFSPANKIFDVVVVVVV